MKLLYFFASVAAIAFGVYLGLILAPHHRLEWVTIDPAPIVNNCKQGYDPNCQTITIDNPPLLTSLRGENAKTRRDVDIP